MLSVIEENLFTPGDPVQDINYPNTFGRVARVTEARYDWIGLPTQLALVFVELVGRNAEIAYHPDELRICKCAIRIPKGVSQCQK